MFLVGCLPPLHFPDIHELLDIADYLYSNPTAVDLNLQGTWLSDRMC